MKHINPCIPWLPCVRGQKHQTYEPLDENTTVEESLPLDIIANILARLPAELVLGCSHHPCKLLSSITTAPSFIDIHLQQATPVIAFDLFSSSNTAKREFNIRFIDQLDNNEYKNSKKRIKTDFSLKCRRRMFSPTLYGSYNGILVYSNSLNRSITEAESHYDQVLFLSNPITQENVTVVSPNRKCFPCGFFFHPTSRDYRILFWYQEGVLFNFVILSLATKLTRRIASFSHPPSSYDSPIIFKGTLHWLVNFFRYSQANGDMPHCSESIVSFNIEKEEFGTMSHPEGGCACGWEGDHSWVTLLEMDGRLCWSASLPSKLVMWFLEDYDKNVWVKRHLVWFSLICQPAGNNSLLGKVICVFGDSLLVMQSFQRLVLYNPRLGTFSEVKYYLWSMIECAVSHVNSLVSLKADGIVTLSL